MPRHDLMAANSMQLDSYCWWLLSAAKERSSPSRRFMDAIGKLGNGHRCSCLPHDSTKRQSSSKR
ncbi:unnamed protein product [Ectocarpus sp. 13 AM-2016]